MNEIVTFMIGFCLSTCNFVASKKFDYVNISDVRLVGGKTPAEGVVEFLIKGAWSLRCPFNLRMEQTLGRPADFHEICLLMGYKTVANFTWTSFEHYVPQSNFSEFMVSCEGINRANPSFNDCAAVTFHKPIFHCPVDLRYVKCKDIDECQNSSLNDCPDGCINTPSSYKMTEKPCPGSGFALLIAGGGLFLLAVLLVMVCVYVYTAKRRHCRNHKREDERNGINNENTASTVILVRRGSVTSVNNPNDFALQSASCGSTRFQSEKKSNDEQEHHLLEERTCTKS